MAKIELYSCDCGCGRQQETLDGWIILEGIDVSILEYRHVVKSKEKLTFATIDCLAKWVSRSLSKNLSDVPAEGESPAIMVGDAF